MKLKELLKDVDYKLVQGDLELEIKDIAYDSRKVKEGVAFVALKGFRVDGHDYIDKAISNGAKCIIVEDNVSVSNDITPPVISSNPFNITLVMSFNKNILVINDISKLNDIIIPKTINNAFNEFFITIVKSFIILVLFSLIVLFSLVFFSLKMNAFIKLLKYNKRSIIKPIFASLKTPFPTPPITNKGFIKCVVQRSVSASFSFIIFFSKYSFIYIPLLGLPVNIDIINILIMASL